MVSLIARWSSLFRVAFFGSWRCHRYGWQRCCTSQSSFFRACSNRSVVVVLAGRLVNQNLFAFCFVIGGSCQSVFVGDLELFASRQWEGCSRTYLVWMPMTLVCCLLENGMWPSVLYALQWSRHCQLMCSNWSIRYLQLLANPKIQWCKRVICSGPRANNLAWLYLNNYTFLNIETSAMELQLPRAFEWAIAVSKQT